jgi:uncharacterized protein
VRYPTRAALTAQGLIIGGVTSVHRVHLILYVADQARSARFYTAVLGMEPTLDVSGMTEFEITASTVLGLMPVDAVRRLLDPLPDQAVAHGVPRAELYLVVDDPDTCLVHAIEAGGAELSPVLPRDWGHRAGYILDPDGHVLAFATPAID